MKLFQKKIKSKAIAYVTTENKLGFKIPMKEKVELLSYNDSKKALLREWDREGKAAVKAMLPNSNILSIDAVQFVRLDGKELI